MRPVRALSALVLLSSCASPGFSWPSVPAVRQKVSELTSSALNPLVGAIATAKCKHAASAQQELIRRVTRAELHFDVLGVAEDATDSDIESAYHGLIKSIPPDELVGDHYGVDEAFRRSKEAHDTLTNKIARAHYNASLRKIRAEQRFNYTETKETIAMHERFDFDGSGELEKHEFRACLKDLEARHRLKKGKLTARAQIFDANENGTICWIELVHVVKFAKKLEKERTTEPETPTSLYICLPCILADQIWSYLGSLFIRKGGESLFVPKGSAPINFVLFYTALAAAIELVRWFMGLPPWGIDDSDLIVLYLTLICAALFLIRDLRNRPPATIDDDTDCKFGAALADALAHAEDPGHAEALSRILEDCIGSEPEEPAAQ